MGRTSNKQRRAANEQTARARAAQMRLQQQRAERRRRLLTIGGASIAVLAVVLVIVFVGLNSSHKTNTHNLRQNFTTAENAALSSVTPATFQQVGTSTSGLIASGLPQKISDPPINSTKPDVLYIGAEFCPYCAAERWPLTIALERFGTFTGLQTMHSSSSDVFANTPTMTYLNAHYQSKYLTFTSVEAEDVNHNKLQQPTQAQTSLWTKYTFDKTTGGDSFPFIDFDGKSVIVGPTYSPQILSGLSQATITNDLKDPSNPVTTAVLKAANYITAALCQVTGNQPSNVCTAPVQSLGGKFATFTSPNGSGSSSGG